MLEMNTNYSSASERCLIIASTLESIPIQSHSENEVQFVNRLPDLERLPMSMKAQFHPSQSMQTSSMITKNIKSQTTFTTFFSILMASIKP